MEENRHPAGYWKTDTKEKIMNDALNYSTKKEWLESGTGGHAAAIKYGYYKEAIAHMKEINKLRGYNSFEKCKELAAKCKTRTEFAKTYYTAYDTATNNNWIEQICSHMIERKRKNGYWQIKENIIKTVIKDINDGKSYTEWQKNHGAAYNNMIKNNWTDEIKKMFPVFKTPQGHWNVKENVIDAALKCSSPKEFQKKYGGAFNAARDKGWYQEATKHMNIKKQKPAGYWTLEKCIIDISEHKYKSVWDWGKNNGSAYGYARKNGWIEEIKRLHFNKK
jgi:hypothetical protein